MWDQRYATDDYFYGTRPNDFLQNEVARLPRGKVLCLGDGEGRNGVWLAEQGFTVTSLDLSPVGLRKAEALARRHGTTLHTVCADLADFDLGQEVWQGVVSIWCHLPSALRRDVAARIVRGLAPGGVALVEAYTPAQLAHGTGGPKDVDMLPTSALLRAEFAGLSVELDEERERDVQEGQGHRGRSAVVQFVARKAASPRSPSDEHGGSR